MILHIYKELFSKFFMNKEVMDIKAWLEEKARRKTQITVTLTEEQVSELKQLSKYHNVKVSHLIDACISRGLGDPYINPPNKEVKEQDDFDLG